MNGKQIKKINDNLKSDRSLWDSVWQDIADYMVFRKSSIVGRMTAGDKKTSQMYDSTATGAGQDLAAWINANMTARGMNWFSLQSKGGEGEDKDFQEWLENAVKIQLKAFRSSNFASEWNETLLDLVFFNTGAMFIEENEITQPGFNGFNFISLPPGSYSIILGRNRRVQGVWRELKLNGQEAVERWGDKVSDDIKESAEKEPDKLHEFIHACFPKTWFGGKHKTQKEFASYYVDAKKGNIMNVGGYNFFPYFVIPWLRESGESYGRGPGWTSLPEVKTANKVGELSLKEWSLSILPPLTMIDQGVIGSINLTSGGLTVVAKTGGHDNLKPLLTGAKYSDNRAKREDLRTVIRDIFHGDKVKFIPPREQTGQMTAYEVARRYQMAQMLLGPTFGNIIDHGLDPLVEVGFNVMLRAGAFGEPPSGMDEVDIEYESPLAKAQRVTEVEAINTTLQAIAQIQPFKEDIFDNFKLDETAISIGKKLGYPTELINATDEVDEIRDGRAQLQAQQQQLEQAALAAKAAKDGAGAMKDMPEGAMEGMMGDGSS